MIEQWGVKDTFTRHVECFPSKAEALEWLNTHVSQVEREREDFQLITRTVTEWEQVPYQEENK